MNKKDANMKLFFVWENTPEVRDFVLKIIGKKIDHEGYVIDAKSGSRVIDSDRQELNADELGLLASGSEIFVKENMVSLADFYDKHLAENQ